MTKKVSPLELLVAAHAADPLPPVKITPKNRFPSEITLIEDFPESSAQPVSVTNNLTINVSMNFDKETLNQALQKSAEVAKNIAAVGAAFIGTAMMLGGKRLEKVKIPLTPKIKVPRI